MNFRNLPRYLGACLGALVRNRPRSYLRMLSRSPLTVAELPALGISMVVDTRDPAISKPILALGEYEKAFADLLLARVAPDTVFLDIGANIGFFTLAAARRITSGRVISVEPDPSNIRLLRAGVALNGLEDRVEAHHLAVSDHNGEVFFSSLGHQANLGARFTARDEKTLRDRSLPGAAAPVRVPSRTVDDLLAGRRVDLVKMDVEGHEPSVLAGMAATLDAFRPVVFSEFAPGTIRHISEVDPADMLAAMLRRDYLISVIEDDGGLTPVAAPAAVLARIGARRHHLDLLFTPRESTTRKF